MTFSDGLVLVIMLISLYVLIAFIIKNINKFDYKGQDWPEDEE